MRILITNIAMRSRTGTELYVRDLARELLRRGHTPVVYTLKPGIIADELRAATIPVVSDLAQIGFVPDVIHGHHADETLTALLRFPGVPAIFVCHDWNAWHDTPPRFPRILRYVAVDDTCRDRLVCEAGVPEDRAQVVLNFVDLERFRPRAQLPARPRRAVVFSNYARPGTYVEAVRHACRAAGLALDVIGAGAGEVCDRPEEVLGQYDLVFAKAKAAIEAMATGCAVVLCDYAGVGPLVTSAEFDRLRRLNFGRRCLDHPFDVGYLATQVARYNREDAAEVTRRIRAEAGLKPAVDRLVALYAEVIEEQAQRTDDCTVELRATSDYLRWHGERTAAVGRGQPSPGAQDGWLVRFRRVATALRGRGR